MSPPCINASIAKTDAGEAPEDIEMAQGCIRAIRHFKSPYVSLENVWGYRNFESFQLIYAALMELNYQIRFWHLCAADYGVAQTRKRLILVASLKGTPKRPEQTHTPEGHVGMFETITRWIGWYEAIEDLIPSLPESAFAEWQLERLEGSVIVGGDFDGAFLTLTAGEKPRAFLVHNNDQRTMPVRDGDDPAFTVMAGGNNSHDHGIKPKAFIASCHQSEGKELTIPIREADEPSVSVGCHSPGHHKAFLMPGGNSSSAEPREPSQTIGDTERVGNIPRAFLANETRDLSLRTETEPAASVVAERGGKERAWLGQGKVVALTVRALARLQSIPDSYVLPEKNSSGCRIVGNAVPPLLMQRIIEAQTSKG